MLPTLDPGPAGAASLEAEALAHLAGPFAVFAADGRLASANPAFDLLLPQDDPARGPGATLAGVLAAIGRRGA
ncbi:hypothetical protein, partial [Falsiroseomonas oryzae]|uniref:hypothetical protein n=1 Tax=Falsiroseomonas oryzae TaxID=2766473 RepID=UPI0022EAC1CA